MTDTAPADAAGPRKRPLRLAILAGGVVLVAVVWLLRVPLRRQLTAMALLANDAPSSQGVEQWVLTAPDPTAVILRLWDTGKTVHRELAIRELFRVGSRDHPLPPALESVAVAAALDPDLKVREEALSYLAGSSDPVLPAMAAAQLTDCDPQVRLLGLLHLRGVKPNVGIPTAARLLDDPDPEVAAMAVSLLGHWSGVNFGLKLADSVPVEDAQTGLKAYRPGSEARLRAGVQRATAWWGRHAAMLPDPHLRVPLAARAALRPVPAGDFRLPSLNGGEVCLSDFRGKVVLINFWTTWCTACAEELPDLVALQKTHHGRLVILGVSLDFVPDEDGEHGQTSPQDILRKIARTAKQRGLDYPVLWDRTDKVGARFNGGELPTNVIVDAQGFVRRRFIGARPLSVLEAMIAKAARPISAEEQR